MMVTLVLDASGTTASAAVFVDAECRAHGRAAMRNRERETLLPLVLEVLASAHATPASVAQIVIGEGPGAFTSLRIAAATAKGLLHGTEASLWAVPSLVLLAATVGDAAVGTRRLVVTDALRQERYCQPVERGEAGWGPLADVVVCAAAEVAAVAAHWRADVVDAVARTLEPDAACWRDVAQAALEHVALASWEPRYGRLAEAQVKWEASVGHALVTPPGHVDVGSAS